MFCVIQQVQLKKPNQYGAYRELVAGRDSWTVNGKPPCWRYRYTGGRFGRPHLEAYKISIHQSCREGGRVRKKQYSIRTMSYYDIVEYSLFDCADGAINAVAEQLDIDLPALYGLIESKLAPLRKRLEADFHQSEEYQTRQKHQQTINDYLKARSDFCAQYSVDPDEYDRCFDVFGVLRNEAYLKQLLRERKARRKAAREESRRTRQQWQERYQQYASGSYPPAAPSTYTANETAMLKQFYKVLSKKYHPDLNPGKDTTAEMQLLNRLKQEWGL